MSERFSAPRPNSSTVFVLLLLLPWLAPHAHGQAARADGDGHLERRSGIEGSLTELRSKQRVLLLVTRSLVLDARDPGQALVREVYRIDPRAGRRHRYAFNTIARKLNNYIKKYGGMSAAAQFGEAEYILVFNLLEYKVVLGRAYPYGELYVILNQPPDSPEEPRVLWRASKVLWAEDAAEEFIRELKLVRGQK